MHFKSFYSFKKLVDISTNIKFMENFSNICFFFKIIIPTMFATAMFTSIKFASIGCYRASEEPFTWQQFQSFWLFGRPNSLFPCTCRQNLLRHFLFLKSKNVCFETNVCFENDKITHYIIHRKCNGNILIALRLPHGYSIITMSVNCN